MINDDPLYTHIQKREDNYKVKRFMETFDFEKYFNRQNLEYKEIPSQYILNECPFCNNINYKGNEHFNRLYVGKDPKLFFCYNCNETGSLFKLLAKLEGSSVREIFAKYLNEEFFEALPQQLISLIEEGFVKAKDNTISEMILPKEFKEVFIRPQEYGKPAYQYWFDRGIVNERDLVAFKASSNLSFLSRTSSSVLPPTPKTAVPPVKLPIRALISSFS